MQRGNNTVSLHHTKQSPGHQRSACRRAASMVVRISFPCPSLFKTRAADQPRCTNLGRGMQADPGMKRCRIHRIGLLKISSIWLEMPTNRGRQREIPRDPCSDASWQSSHLTGAKETLKTVLLCSSRDSGGDVISVGSARGSGFGDFQLLQLPMRFSILQTCSRAPEGFLKVSVRAQKAAKIRRQK
jgi:hypothetical protein